MLKMNRTGKFPTHTVADINIPVTKSKIPLNAEEYMQNSHRKMHRHCNFFCSGKNRPMLQLCLAVRKSEGAYLQSLKLSCQVNAFLMSFLFTLNLLKRC